MNLLKNFSLALFLVFSGTSSAGLVFDLKATPGIATNGDIISVNLFAALDGDPSLGAFDLDVLFNTTEMSFLSYNMDNATGLGDPVLFDYDDFSLGEHAPGTIGLTGLSYLTDIDLGLFQGGRFLLAEMQFEVIDIITPGLSLFSIDPIAFSDANGGTLNAATIGATVRAPGIATVPEPASIALIGLGLIAFFASTPRQKKS